MPLHIIRTLQSTRRTVYGFFAKFRLPLTTTTPSGKLYRNIHDLPLHKFIDCLIDEDIHALVIEGFATPYELESKWAQITDEYTAAVGDAEYKIYLNTYKDMICMAVDLQNIEILIHTLRKAFYQPLLDELNKLIGSNVQLDGLMKENYHKQLDVLYKRSRGLKIKMDLKRLQYESISKKYETKGGKPTREYFDSMLITLSDHAGFQLTDRISVFEYCERIKRLSKYVEQTNKKVHGRS